MKSEIFRIVFDDSTFLVIEKLMPFLSQRADEGQGEGLYEFVARALKQELFPVHRLDREVLGLMVIAKTKAAAENLSDQFRSRSVKKGYETIVKGRVNKDADILIHYLRKNPKTNYVTVFPRPTEGAKRAELHYRVLARGENWTRLFVELKTGRSHQIRVQLAKIGHPILGDERYKNSKARPENLPEQGGIQLKSVQLGIFHPSTKNFLEWNLLSIDKSKVVATHEEKKENL